MIRKIAFGFGVFGWFVVAFLFTLWLTFPSGRLARRLEWEVQNATGDTLAMTMSSAMPWWIGVKAKNVTLMTLSEGGGGEEETEGGESSGDPQAHAVLTAEALRVAASPWSLFGNPHLYGSMDLKNGRISYQSTLTPHEESFRLADLAVQGDGLPVSAVGSLLAPWIGDGFVGEGHIDLDLSLATPEKFKESTGKATLQGKDLTITLRIPDPISGDGTFEIGPVKVADLDILVTIADGKATIERGKVMSDAANLLLSGDLSLQDTPSRSRTRFKLVISDIGEQFSAFEGLMSRAKWDDGKYHYSIACSVSRLNADCIRADHVRRTTPGGSRSITSGASREEDEAALSPEEQAEREERRKLREQRIAERKDRMKKREEDGEGPIRPGEHVVPPIDEDEGVGPDPEGEEIQLPEEGTEEELIVPYPPQGEGQDE